MRQCSETTRGFTLLELMVGITVMGILLALAVPSFTDLIRNNRTAAQANDFVLALTVARNEAISRSTPVSICAANSAGTACAGAVTDWGNGWLTFVDASGVAGDIDDDDVLLSARQRVSGGLQFNASNNLGFLRYGRNGAPTNVGAVTAGTTAIAFGVQHDQCSGTNRRSIAIDRTGRSNLTKVACP